MLLLLVSYYILDFSFGVVWWTSSKLYNGIVYLNSARNRIEDTKIDDEFAKSLGAKDLKNLKELITNQIQNQYKMNLEAISKEKILNKLEEIHKINLPENLVESELALITQNLKKEDSESMLDLGFNDKNVDELYEKAINIVLEQQKISTSFIQRYLQIGYNRAARIVEKMEEDGYITEANNAGKRSVLRKSR